MQQRQLRLGDVLDDYCPRERRLTNHAVVAMVGEEVKQTRCTTCDAEHEYKHAKVPRARKKGDLAAVLAAGPVPLPKKSLPSVTAPTAETSPSTGESRGELHDRRGSAGSSAAAGDRDDDIAAAWLAGVRPAAIPRATSEVADRADAGDATLSGEDEDSADAFVETDEGIEDGAPPSHDVPAHRRLIRATLPRVEGQPPQAQRQAPDFTIRQPTGGRPGRFRPRSGGRGPEHSQGRSQGFDRHAGGHGGPPRHGERQHGGHRPAKHQGFNRKRSK